MIKVRKFWGLRPWKRHSTILMVVGILFVLVGFQYIVSTPSRMREISLAVVLQIAPIEFWGGVFVFAGLLSMLSARWPPLTETWGYMVLTGLSAGWSATYLMGILFFGSPATNSTQVFLWGCLAFMWWAISGLLNPDRTAVTNNGGL
jgi:hypothetical protein